MFKSSLTKKINPIFKLSFFLAMIIFVLICSVFFVSGFFNSFDGYGNRIISIENSFMSIYLILSLTILLPFTIIGLTFQGEKPLIPLGFLFAVLLFIAIIGAIIHLVFRKKIARWKEKELSKFQLVVSIVCILFFLFIIVFPFFVEMDFF